MHTTTNQCIAIIQRCMQTLFVVGWGGGGDV